MAARFNRLARGLLGFLDAKVAGQQAPQLLADELRGTLELLPFYLAQQREVLQGTTAGPLGVGSALFLTGLTGPTPEEIWYVERFSVKMDAAIAAGQHVVVSPAMMSLAAAGTAPITLTGNRTLANQIGWISTNAADGPFVMVPGDQLGVVVDSVSGLATTATGFGIVSRIRI